MIFLFTGNFILFSIALHFSTSKLHFSNALYQNGKALASFVEELAVFFPSHLNPHHWDYGPGRNGPENWKGKCGQGRRQSPVDIRLGKLNFDQAILEPLQFVNYDVQGTLELKNNGHGVIIHGFEKWPAAQRPYIKGGGLGMAKYLLLQFHFHWAKGNGEGSEHTLNGLHFPVELHFVHVREDLDLSEALKEPNGLAAVGIFYQIGIGHRADQAMSNLAEHLGRVVEKDATTPLANYSPAGHLPHNLNNFYRYNGSLTTPDCEEAVIWTLMENPVPISQKQLDLLRAVHGPNGPMKEGDGYARPVQPLNGRKILFRTSKIGRSVLGKKRRRRRRHY